MAEFGAQAAVKVGTSFIGAGITGTTADGDLSGGLMSDAINVGGFAGDVASTMAQVLELAYEDEFEMTGEQRDLVNRAREGWEAFAGHVAGSYDFGEDDWKVTNDGDLVFDGAHDLYDKEGNLLRQFEGNGGYTAALAEHLGFSETEANDLIVAAGFHSFENGTFVTGDGTNVMNDEQIAVDPGEAFAARYFVQRDYIDNVGAYGGSMTAGLDAARDDLMSQVASGQASGEVFRQLELVERLTDFGEQYDTTIHGRREGSFGVQGLLNHSAAAAMDQDAIAAALNEVAGDQSLTDNHPMYQHILDGTFAPLLRSDGLAGPTVGPQRTPFNETYITARTLYKDGSPHGWVRDGYPSLSVDLGTQLLPLEAILFADSTVRAQGEPFGWSDSSGGFAQVDAGPLDLRYVHLARSWELQQSQALHQAAMMACYRRT